PPLVGTAKSAPRSSPARRCRRRVHLPRTSGGHRRGRAVAWNRRNGLSDHPCVDLLADRGRQACTLGERQAGGRLRRPEPRADQGDDGAHRPLPVDARQAAHRCRERRTSVHRSEAAGFTSDPLVQLASATGGQYFGASSTSDLAHVYAAIALALKKTWRVQYVTAAVPGDHLRLTASVVGEGSTTKLAAIPPGETT